MKEIDSLVDREISDLSLSSVPYEPRSSGRKFPFILNLAMILVILLCSFIIYKGFNSGQNGYILRDVSQTNRGADIISALLDETKNELSLKKKEIKLFESEMESIDNKLKALGLDSILEKEKLQARRNQLQKKLEKSNIELNLLESQISYQTESLNTVSGNSESVIPNSIQELMNKETLTNIYYTKLKSGVDTISLYISSKAWDHAVNEIIKLEEFISEFNSTKKNIIHRKDILSHQALLKELYLLTVSAKENWPETESENEPDLLQEINNLRNEREELTGINSRLNSELDKNIMLWNILPDLLDHTISDEKAILSSDMSKLPESLQNQIISIRKNMDTNEKNNEALNAEIRRLLQKDKANTENLTTQEKKLEDALHALSENELSLNQRQRELTEYKEKWNQFTTNINSVSSNLKEEQSAQTLENSRQSYEQILKFFESNGTVDEFFPDFPVVFRAASENLIKEEASRASKETEERLLAQMISTTGKVEAQYTDQLAIADNKNEDTYKLLDSLIKEIDLMRSEPAVTAAMGTVISVNKPHVTVRKASRPDLFNIKRIFISRRLDNGERIPIADAKIKAMSSNNLILEITETIIPAIYPEINDIVNIEY